ncbi:MAG TPA: flagellar protein FliT [Oscillatoriaceae cyanobacterium]
MASGLHAATLRAAYEGLAALSAAQLTAVSTNELARYWQLSAERERLFAQLQSLESQLAGLGADDRAAIARLIPQILEQDAAIEKHLDTFVSRSNQELGTLRTGLRALNAYAIQTEREAMFIDRNS